MGYCWAPFGGRGALKLKLNVTLETQKAEIFNTIQPFRPIGIRQWCPACDLSAGVSETISDRSAVPSPETGTCFIDDFSEVA